MLVWFMHGASVRQPGYADPLRSRLIETFSDRGLAIPEFYSSYWGEALGDTTQVWSWVQQDLEAFKWDHPEIDIDEVFHYRQRREQLISGFFNDIFNYLNSKRGRDVRRIIAVQFLNFLAEISTLEEDLHIVAHSLSSVILWDILFSAAIDPSDPAFYIRQVIKGLGDKQGRKVKLRSITTIGSPLLFFNRLMEADVQRLKQFASRYTATPLRWINIIHASDIFAYPIRASLELEGSTLYLRDHYLGERNFLKQNIGDVAMALGLVTDHSHYWRSRRVAQLVTANLLADSETLEQNSPILDLGEFD